jgi:hypothetical protein
MQTWQPKFGVCAIYRHPARRRLAQYQVQEREAHRLHEENALLYGRLAERS